MGRPGADTCPEDIVLWLYGARMGMYGVFSNGSGARRGSEQVFAKSILLRYTKATRRGEIRRLDSYPDIVHTVCPDTI
jgi:hypothetical protein